MWFIWFLMTHINSKNSRVSHGLLDQDAPFYKFQPSKSLPFTVDMNKLAAHSTIQRRAQITYFLALTSKTDLCLISYYKITKTNEINWNAIILFSEATKGCYFVWPLFVLRLSLFYNLLFLTSDAINCLSKLAHIILFLI